MDKQSDSSESPPKELQTLDGFGEPRCAECKSAVAFAHKVRCAGVCWFVNKDQSRARGIWCRRWPLPEKEKT